MEREEEVVVQEITTVHFEITVRVEAEKTPT